MFGFDLAVVIPCMEPKCTGSNGLLVAKPVLLKRQAKAEHWHDYAEPLRKAVTAVARKYRLDRYDTEELQSDLWVKLLADDGRRLRGYRGDASLKTYFISIGRNLVLDRRNKDWGKWRPSRVARRLGADAVALDKLIRRDGLSTEEAIATLCRAGGGCDSGRLHSIATKLTRPPGRRMMCLARLDDVTVPAQSEAILSNTCDQAHQLQRVKRALRMSLQTLPADDRNLIGWRFGHAMTVAQIALELGTAAPLLYRRLGRVLRALRAALTAHGVDVSIVGPLLELRDADFDLDLATCLRTPSLKPDVEQRAS